MFKITVSADGREAQIECREAGGEAGVRLDAEALTGLIESLVGVRAEMKPVFSGHYAPGKITLAECDNLLWEAVPDPSRRGISLGFYHAGLGWVPLRLSRAQAEDFMTSMEFALADLGRMPGFQNARQNEKPNNLLTLKRRAAG